jgi:hypothetical protein
VEPNIFAMDHVQEHKILVYVFAKTIRSNFEYFAFSSNTGLSPPLAHIFSELLKLTIAAIHLFHRNNGGIGISWNGVTNRDIKEILRYAIPAALDAGCCLVYFTALGFTSTSLLQVFVLAKLPLTAVLHHAWIRRQQMFMHGVLSYGFVWVWLFSSGHQRWRNAAALKGGSLHLWQDLPLEAFSILDY